MSLLCSCILHIVIGFVKRFLEKNFWHKNRPPICRKVLCSKDLGQLFTIHAATHPKINAKDRTITSPFFIPNPFLLEKQYHKQGNYQQRQQ